MKKYPPPPPGDGRLVPAVIVPGLTIPTTFLVISTLLEKFWRISLYLTDDATVYCKTECDVKFGQVEGNGRNERHIELNSSVIS